MELTPKLKAEIDSWSYVDLLRRIRFTPAGDPLFQGESGDYIMTQQRYLRSQPGGENLHVAASKQIGWN